MEADDAPIFFIAEKIKKFASKASKIERITRVKFDFPEISKAFKELWSKNKNGKITTAVMMELKKSNVIGGVLYRIFWSIV